MTRARHAAAAMTMNIPSVHLWQAILGVVFVLNAFIVDWFFEQGQHGGQLQRDASAPSSWVIPSS